MKTVITITDLGEGTHDSVTLNSRDLKKTSQIKLKAQHGMSFSVYLVKSLVVLIILDYSKKIVISGNNKLYSQNNLTLPLRDLDF